MTEISGFLMIFYFLTNEIILITETLVTNCKMVLVSKCVDLSNFFVACLVSDEIFDGFICYAKEDRSFAHEILTRLEAPPYCRKICIDYRDYVPGNCRLDQTAKIIEHRCKHLVAIMSPNFTNSSNAGFQVRIALTLSPGNSCTVM
jgi:hypothetical protein